MAIVSGSEITTNTFLAGNQHASNITMLANGCWVIVWESENQDGSGEGLYQQLYDTDGVAIGTETRVNMTTSGNQSDFEVTSLPDGGWVVAWTSKQDDVGNVYQQRFNPAGTKNGSETLVNVYLANTQANPSLAANPMGDWLVAWDSGYGQDGSGYGVYAQAFRDEAGIFGAPPNSPYDTQDQIVPANRVGDQQYSQVVTLADGGWLVTWLSDGQDGSGYGVYQQRFTYNATRYGPSTRVNLTSEGSQWDQHVVALGDGGWVVTWTSEQENGLNGIYLQAFDEDGARNGTEIHVNTKIDSTQWFSSIAELADGGWIVTWESRTVSTAGIYQQAFTSAGTKVGGQQLVSPASVNSQTEAKVTALEDGGWVVTWVQMNGDGTQSEIFQQAFRPNGDKIGGTTRVSDPESGLHWNTETIALQDGGWVVSWDEGQSINTMDSAHRVFHIGKERLDGTNVGNNLSGTQWDDEIYGLGGRDTVQGKAGDDDIFGGLGNDRLIGGLGNDNLSGGGGRDTFVFNTAFPSADNLDFLQDFQSVYDVIEMENSLFPLLRNVGGLKSGLFKNIFTGTQDANDVILYNPLTGELFYDSNGLQADGQTQFAAVTDFTALRASDFHVT